MAAAKVPLGEGWLSRLADWWHAMPDTSVPEGLTDDLTIALPPEKTVDEVADQIIDAALRGIPHEVIVTEVMADFDLTEEDAELALDRAFGGVVRAGTRNRANCPPRRKDPLAWASFQ